jgi:putative glycosyltransferase
LTGEQGVPELSIVSTLYRSEGTLREFYGRMVVSAEKLGASFEIVFVNDGSPDRSVELVRELMSEDPRIVLVDLSRNFGHHQAAVAGLTHARGRRIFIIDVDLEERPEWLPDFVAEHDRTQADVVYGVSRVRKGTLARRLFGSVFWKLFNALSETPVPANPCTVRLMSRRYVDALLRLPDKNLFLAGNYAWVGFHQVGHAVEKGLRPTASTYTASRLMALFLDAVTSFTSYPLRLIFLSGVSIALVSVLAGSALLAWKIAAPQSISLGWPSIMVSLWFLGGIIIAFIGIIGIYLSKIFNEAKDRPLFLVKEIRRHAGSSEP